MSVQTAQATDALRLVQDTSFVVELCRELVSNPAALVREAVADALSAHAHVSSDRPEGARTRVRALLRQLAESDASDAVRSAAEDALYGSEE